MPQSTFSKLRFLYSKISFFVKRFFLIICILLTQYNLSKTQFQTTLEQHYIKYFCMYTYGHQVVLLNMKIYYLLIRIFHLRIKVIFLSKAYF